MNAYKGWAEFNEKKKKPFYKKWWFWVIVAIVVILMVGNGKTGNSDGTTPPTDPSVSHSQTTPVTKTDTIPSSEPSKETEPDLSNIETEYTLTAGHYTAGIDIPVGKCDVVAVSGTGNLSSSNMFMGGVNEMFGIDDGNGFYTESFNGLKLPAGTVLSLNNRLVVKLTYTKVERNFSGRAYNEASAIELSSGNYTAGEDFPAGIYKITAISGTGNLSSSNMFNGGLNEMFGIDDGTGFYNGQFLNAEFSDGCELTVSGGLIVKLIPIEE